MLGCYIDPGPKLVVKLIVDEVVLFLEFHIRLYGRARVTFIIDPQFVLVRDVIWL